MSFVVMKLVTAFGGFEEGLETERLGGGVRRRRLSGGGGGGGGINHGGVD